MCRIYKFTLIPVDMKTLKVPFQMIRVIVIAAILR